MLEIRGTLLCSGTKLPCKDKKQDKKQVKVLKLSGFVFSFHLYALILVYFCFGLPFDPDSDMP
jgi:hypothetical protein